VLLRSTAPGDEPLTQRAQSVRISARGPDGELLSPRVVSTSDGSVSIPALPAGEGRVIEIAGIGPEGAVVSRARSGPLSIGSGTRELQLFIGRVERFSRTPPDLEGNGRTLRVARAFHSQTLLVDGRVLLAGGAASPWRPEQAVDPNPTRAIELLDGDSLLVRSPRCAEDASDTSCMASARVGHTASILPTGNILLVGGRSRDALGGGDSESEIFSTDGDAFFQGAALAPPRRYHAATNMGDGIAIVSGQNVASGLLTELSAKYRGSTSGADFETLVGLPTARRNFTLLRLLDGRLLAAGGFDDGGQPTGLIDTFSAGAGQWEQGDTGLGVPRAYHTSTLLGDGSVLFIGGLTAGGRATPIIERLEPDGTLDEVGRLRIGRWAHTTTLLRDGRLLVSGGFALSANGSPSQSCELLQFDSAQRLQNSATDCRMHVPRAGHSATLLQSGWVLVAGGVTETSDGSTGGADSETRPGLTNTAEVFIY
jgi:hypothetical protein